MKRSSSMKVEKMFQSRIFNKTSNEKNWNEPLSLYPWAERSQYSIPSKSQKHKGKKRKHRGKRFQGGNSNLKSMLIFFLKNSSIYALNRIGNSPTPARKIFWVIILIIGIIGCLSQVGQYLASYYKYPVIVNIEWMNSNEQQFPSVTLCNMNPIRNYFLLCLLEKEIDGCSDEFNETITKNPSMENRDPICEIPWITPNTTLYTDWDDLIHALTYKRRVKYGHQFEDFVKYCTFDDDTCSEFEISNSYIFGNCFTFNPNGTKSSKSVGPTLGLELFIDLELDEYTDFTPSSGVRVQIHEPSLPHDIEAKGITLTPGFEHYIKVTKSSISRLPSPFKDHCKNYDLGDSRKLCDDLCKDEVLRSRCFCSQLKHDHEKEIQQCDLTNPLVMCCVYTIDEEITCDCPLACHEIEYKTELSSATWPSEAYYEAVKYDLWSYEINGSEGEKTLEEFKKSHLLIKIYYDSLGYTIYNQDAAYQSSELLSMIGGQMGLWLGLSLIAIFECLESIIMLLRGRNHSNIR